GRFIFCAAILARVPWIFQQWNFLFQPLWLYCVLCTHKSILRGAIPDNETASTDRVYEPDGAGQRRRLLGRAGNTWQRGYGLRVPSEQRLLLPDAPERARSRRRPRARPHATQVCPLRPPAQHGDGNLERVAHRG